MDDWKNYINMYEDEVEDIFVTEWSYKDVPKRYGYNEEIIDWLYFFWIFKWDIAVWIICIGALVIALYALCAGL
jgi:hypothetical protein